MISVRSLSKSYGSVPVLKGLNCDIQRGKITGLAGPNACGKTTLVKSILGLVIPDAGEITIGGRPSTDFGYRELIGYMPQHAEFPGNLNPLELFQLISALRQGKPRRQSELISRFRLEPFLKKPLGTLSTGTRQKVSAVAALMFNPPVLILDEPTAGFDPVSCLRFKELLLEAVAEGVSVLIVSHIMPELEQLVDDLIFLLDGRPLFRGPVEKLLEQTAATGLETGIVKLMTGEGAEAVESKNGAFGEAEGR